MWEGGTRGATCQLSYCSWVPPPLLCTQWTLVLPGAHFTVMLVLSQDRTTWFSNDGVLNHNKTWGLLRTH